MPHRAEVIVQTVAAQLADALAGVPVVRGQSDPMPADDQSRVRVAASQETLAEGPLGFYDAMLTVDLFLFARETTPQAAEETLLELRRSTHKVMRGAVRASLRAYGWVHDVIYGGAEAPVGDSAKSMATAQQRTPWQVHYRMPLDDPSA